MPLAVIDIVYQGGGMIVAFNDNSVANVVQTVINGQVVYAGLSVVQAEALAAFNANNISDQARAVDPRLGEDEEVEDIPQHDPYHKSRSMTQDFDQPNWGSVPGFSVVAHFSTTISLFGAQQHQLPSTDFDEPFPEGFDATGDGNPNLGAARISAFDVIKSIQGGVAPYYYDLVKDGQSPEPAVADPKDAFVTFTCNELGAQSLTLRVVDSNTGPTGPNTTQVDVQVVVLGGTATIVPPGGEGGGTDEYNKGTPCV
jgi:hypothetical protein